VSTTSPGEPEPSGSDRFEFDSLLLEPMGMPAKVVDGAVELPLVGAQRGTAQIGTWPAPGVAVGVDLESHHRQEFDRRGEFTEVSGSSAQVVRSGGGIHRRAVGGGATGGEGSEIRQLHGAIGDDRRLVGIVGDEQGGHTRE